MRCYAIAILSVGLLVTSTFASVEEIRLHVEGLACPFCVFGIEKSLKKVPGVTQVETTVRTGVVRVQLNPDTSLDPSSLRQAVDRSGFTLGHIEATIAGRLIEREDGLSLRSEPAGQVFLLVEGGEGEFSGKLSSETREKLMQAAAEGDHELTIIGRVHSHVGMPPALGVLDYKRAE